MACAVLDPCRKTTCAICSPVNMEGHRVILVFLVILIGGTYGQYPPGTKIYEKCNNDVIDFAPISSSCFPNIDIKTATLEELEILPCQLSKDALPCVQDRIVDKIPCLTAKENAFFKSAIEALKAEADNLCSDKSKVKILASEEARQCYATIQKQVASDIMPCLRKLSPGEVQPQSDKGWLTMMCESLDAHGKDMAECMKDAISNICSGPVVNVIQELLDIEKEKLTCSSAGTAVMDLFLVVAVLTSQWIFNKFL